MIAREWIVDRAVLPDTVLVGARIAAIDDRIVAVDQLAAAPTAERLRGTLLPGLVDLQVNGAGGRSVAEANVGALDVVARAVRDGGAVAFLPTLVSAPWPQLLQQVEAVAAWIAAYDGDGAVPLGLHVEGPFLTAAGAHEPAALCDPSRERIDELLRAARGTLRLVTLSPARAGAAAATTQLTAAGVAVSLGHCDTTDGFEACVAAGAAAVTHLFNVMGPMHHRNVGLAALSLDEPRLRCCLIPDGVHVHPAMLRLAFRALGVDRTILVTDAAAAAGMPDGSYRLGDVDVTAAHGVVRDAHGRLAGSALTMALLAHRFLQFLPEAGPWTLARAASSNPAALVGADRHGKIAVGSRAAFTLLGDDGSVRAIV